MPNPDQSLDQFLAELEAEYAALGDKIAFIRERLIRKTLYGVVTTLILVGVLSGLLLSVIALNT